MCIKAVIVVAMLRTLPYSRSCPRPPLPGPPPPQVLERQEVKDAVNECPYRLAQEGLPLMLPYVTRQRLELPPEVLVSLLRERSLLLPGGEGEEGGTTAAGACGQGAEGRQGEVCSVRLGVRQGGSHVGTAIARALPRTSSCCTACTLCLYQPPYTC